MKFKIQTFLRSRIKSKFRCFGSKSGIDLDSESNIKILSNGKKEEISRLKFSVCLEASPRA